MLDETEPMEFFEILHFENLLKSYVHLGSQRDILLVMDIHGMKALLPQKLFATLHSLSDSEIQKPPYTQLHTVLLDPVMIRLLQKD